ncbi:hypothetical protein Poli38472_008543 [Pythium oligandrum]|uniref:HTH CENPB-type domain-containing protein n=1 Tax=Pythium oligandrum TaxID=41045 RepID=A0A8K1C3S8_PYTOL|nr:hypothetical protein Poli38472_008543 [Pythium oligandrum]|eukprot:TMW55895.1 hypothetical protein Poli38472_008543 [Pythium oligandrum]
MGKQGRGRRLTDKERMEIIALTRQNPRIKHVELAVKYNVNESTIRKWRAQDNAKKIEARYHQGVTAARDLRQRGQAVRNAQFDAALYEWVSAMLKQGVDLAPVKVREKARALAVGHEGMEDFKASSGWYYRFCRRYGIPCGSLARVPHPIDQSALPITTSIGNGTVEIPAHSMASLQDMTSSEGTNTLSGNSPVRIQHSASHTDNDLLLNELQGIVNSLRNPPVATIPPRLPSSSAVVSSPGSLMMFTVNQTAITHASHHFKDILTPQARLRLVKHLSRTPGEAEMYLVMDDETRLEYVKEFSLADVAESGSMQHSMHENTSTSTIV